MVKSHRFVHDFFSEEDWITYYKGIDILRTTWLALFEVTRNTVDPHKDEIRIRIEHKRLYNLYVRFTRELYGASKARNSDTFWNELEQIGITRHAKRRKINGKNKTCVDIYFRGVAAHMKKLYPAFEPKLWQHEEEFKEFSKTLENMRTSDYDYS